MPRIPPHGGRRVRQRGLADMRYAVFWMALAYSALVVYASLYPLTGWVWPTNPPWSFLFQPLPKWWTAFDLVANVLGYIPLGALMSMLWVRRHEHAGLAVLRAGFSASLLSLLLEFGQAFMQQRVPSNVDWGLNSLGALMGAALGIWLAEHRAVEAAIRWRRRWWRVDAPGGFVLWCLWPFALLYPLPMPFALGRWVEPFSQALLGWAADSVLLTQQPWGMDLGSALQPAGLSPGGQWLLMVVSLLTPCLLAFTLMRPTWRRGLAAGMVLLAGALMMSLSTALAFSPQYAGGWLSPLVMAAMAVAGLLMLALLWVPMRMAAALLVLCIGVQMALINQLPADVFVNQSLQSWEQGRFIRFHGLSQWLGWLWPLGVLGFALRLLGRSN